MLYKISSQGFDYCKQILAVMLRNSEKTHKLLPVKIFFLDSAACFMLAKAPDTSAGYFFPSCYDNDKTCFLCHCVLLAIKKSMTFFHILCCLNDCSCDKFKAFFFFVYLIPHLWSDTCIFYCSNWHVSFWFSFVFCQKKTYYVHLHADIHTSEKLFLFFILNLWGGCE